ncbi:hypothetical protein KAF25_009487 [Fusarium avenaceum]|uniref:Uncharacterized protein n=1 Tax=Fusarium avenaceum TaxID=40199 RepID=A0A9P7HI17_9HYPO|nr:hypothetical protein KAF25_009487 [Fusarium avenaceum]
MKFTIAATLAVLSGAYAAESASTTITCPECHAAATQPDIVTRSALPTTSCTAMPLTVVTNTKGGSGAAAPTGAGTGAASTPTAQVPVNAAGANKVSGGVAVAAALAAVYML